MYGSRACDRSVCGSRRPGRRLLPRPQRWVPSGRLDREGRDGVRDPPVARRSSSAAALRALDIVHLEAVGLSSCGRALEHRLRRCCALQGTAQLSPPARRLVGRPGTWNWGPTTGRRCPTASSADSLRSPRITDCQITPCLSEDHPAKPIRWSAGREIEAPRDTGPENDRRHFLYREYLHVISEFRPAIFVMENVKGILSSQVQGQQIFQSILSDLHRPDLASGDDEGLEYELFALDADSGSLFDLEPERFIVQAEFHGVPQARHRVIIFGVRRDVCSAAGSIARLDRMAAPTVRDVIADLPRLRSALSFRGEGIKWAEAFDTPLMSCAVAALLATSDPTLAQVARAMESARVTLQRAPDSGTGADTVHMRQRDIPVPSVLKSWFQDRPLTLLANHESRAHMPSDLIRYLFVASFGSVTGSSPRLSDFPRCLLPDHRNVNAFKPEAAIFKDRFRVQVADSHSMTVTSHIAKDGHAFVHFDPTQCRSLTVREAARLQTFPDSYTFLGNRTSQYTQVGNAVPPYLAHQIAEIAGRCVEARRTSRHK